MHITEVVHLHTTLTRLWTLCLAGERLLIACSTATDANRLVAWINKEIAAHDRRPASSPPISLRALAVTAEFLKRCEQKGEEAPAANITAYTTKHDISLLAYTLAMGVGTSIDQPQPYWSAPVLFGRDHGGPSAELIAQALRRGRHAGPESPRCCTLFIAGSHRASQE